MKIKNLLVYHAFPLFVISFSFIWVAIVGNDNMLDGEFGIVELSTPLYLVIAIGFCISGIIKAGKLGIKDFLRAWLIILIVGAAYFALEEISYGQHFFGWKTAEPWKQLNDQGETNLHNVSALFDQLPRTLLELGILIGGVLMPLYRHFRHIKLEESNRLYWQWPTLDCVTIGLLVVLIRPVFSVYETDIIATGEMKEALMAVFIMLYCISLHTRIRSKMTPEPGRTGES